MKLGLFRVAIVVYVIATIGLFLFPLPPLPIEGVATMVVVDLLLSVGGAFLFLQFMKQQHVQMPPFVLWWGFMFLPFLAHDLYLYALYVSPDIVNVSAFVKAGIVLVVMAYAAFLDRKVRVLNS